MTDSKPNILMVDDNENNLLALETVLEGMDCNLVRALSGREALRCLLNQHFAVVLLDVQMPDMDGFETAQLIRNREQSQDVPIIFVTGEYLDLAHVSVGYSFKAVDYLLKPYNPEILRTKVEVFVELFRKNQLLKEQATAMEEANRLLQQEIAERTRAENEIRLLQSITDLVIGSGDIQTAMEGALKKVCDTTRWVYGEAWVLSQDDSSFECSPAWYSSIPGVVEFRQESESLKPERCSGFLWRVWSTKKPVWLRDITLEADFVRAEAADKAGFKASVGIPLINGEKAVAVMVFFLQEAQEKDDRLVMLISTVAAQLGLALQHKSLETDLKVYTEKLERSNRDLQEFAYVASHDLQEPLRKILAFGDRLTTKYTDVLDETGQDYLKRMQGASQRMQILINDLLSLSRVATRAHAFEQVDMNVLAQEVIADLENQIERTAAVTEIGELPVIQADATQIRQVLQNLISNALKFHSDARPPVIRLSSMIDGDTCRLTVEDNGIGFDNQYLDRIFKPFQRLHTREEFEGSGMGLAICRRIVERHGGSITAASVLGKGSAFLITLPLRQKEGNS